MNARIQKALKVGSWVLAGLLALGAFLDAISNAIAIVTPTVTVLGTVGLAAIWMTAQLWMNRRPVAWRASSGSDVLITSLGMGTTAAFAGAIMLLWVPRMADAYHGRHIQFPGPPSMVPKPMLRSPSLAAVEELLRDSSPKAPANSARKSRHYVTLRELFRTDFPNLLKSRRERKLVKDGIPIQVEEQLYMDFLGRSKFVGFFVPGRGDTYPVAQYLAEIVPLAFEMAQGVSGGMVGEHTESEALVFTGRVYLYHEARLSLQDQATLERRYEEKGYEVQFRGPEYLAFQLIARANETKPN